MRLFELARNPDILMELNPNNPVDQELARTAKKAQTAGSLDPNDIEPGEDGMNPMADQMGGMEPDMGGGPQQMPNEPDQMMPDMEGMNQQPEVDTSKPVNQTLASLLQGEDYVQNYAHDDPQSPSHPVNVMQLEIDELSDLRNRMRGMVTRHSMSDRAGMFASREISAASDLITFIDQVVSYKKMAAKDEDGGKRQSKVKPKTAPEPKTKPGEVKQRKRK